MEGVLVHLSTRGRGLCCFFETKKTLLLNSCPGQTQQQQEEGTFSQVSGSTGNKQAEYWKTFW